ncbi:MAG TPA: PAS domain-containing protein, partial [Actinomycetota bacterium]|nr:PAS domain-containing protein [Actinomycetota bacterium]
MDRVVSKRALAYLGAGLAAAAVYAVIPGESQRFAYPVFPLAASIATGLRARTASTHRASWWMLAVAFLLFACADVLYEVIAYTSFPGPPDVCFLAGFAVLTVAAFRFRELIQTYTAERSLDTLIAGTGAALVVWIVWVEPAATAVQASPGAAALALGYPVLDLMVLTLLVSGGPLRGSRAWLIAGTVGYLVGDTWWSVVSLKGTYETGIWPDAMWLWAYIAWGAAALDRTRPGRWDPQPFAVRARFILIGSLGLPTVALAFHEIRYQRLPESSVLIMAFVLGGLVLVRLQLAQRREWQANRQREQSFDALKKSLEREGHAVDAVLVLEQRNRSILDSAGEGIIGTNRDGITTFANPAAAAMLGRTVEELTGHKLSEVIRRVHTDGAPQDHSDPQIMDMIAQGHDWHT